ncbi:MAG: sigma-70 family RNA polymerase sigma factor [Planctomycetes bacterium]|nr:sigma-70 family RNA polymerase sigma factor [Planctomycetota bacterium]
MEPPSDEQLLREFLAGKAASFELLARRHMPELFQFAMRFTADSLAAEDVVQEALIQVYASAANFDPHRRFKPWLFTIAANKARDYLRRRVRRRELPFEASVSPEGEGDRRFLDLLSTDEEQVDSDLQIEDRRRMVRAAVQAMPDKLREVLILAYYHRFAYKDIAEIVDIPVGTVKSRLHAAIAAFRESYLAAVGSGAGEPAPGEGRTKEA